VTGFRFILQKFFKDWLKNKQINRELGYKISATLGNEIENMRKKLDYAERWGDGKELKNYMELLQACIDMGMPNYYKESAAEWIKQQLKRDYPEVLDTVQRQLVVAINEISRAKESFSIE